MHHRTGLGVALVGVASFCACGGRTSFLEDFNDGAAGASSGVAGASGAASAGATGTVGGFEQGGAPSGFAGAPSGFAGAPSGFAGAPMLGPPVAGAGGALGVAGAAGFAGAGVAGGPPLACSTGVRDGGYVNPCFVPGNGGSSGECRAFDLVGAYWNGSMSDSCIEAVDDVSAATGVGIERGMLGDLHSWESEQFVETEDGLRVGAIGKTLDGELELHLLELASGDSWSVPIAHDDSLAGVLSSGAFVGAYLAGGSLYVEFIDPLTGKATSLGSIDGIGGWSAQIVLDHAKNRVYTLADGSLGSSNLYSFDLSNGVSSSKPLPWDGFIGGVTTNGQIVATSYAGGSWVVSLIDPLTAIATEQGMFGELDGASFLVYDSTLGVAHTINSNAQGVPFLYNLDLASGVATQVETKRMYGLAKQ